MVPVGEREELLSQLTAVLQTELTNTADFVVAPAALDLTVGDGGMPALVAIEIAEQMPHSLDGGLDHRASAYRYHLCRPATFGSLARCRVQCVKSGLEDAITDKPSKFLLAPKLAIEFRRPLGKGSITVGDRGELEGGDVIFDAHGRL